MKDWFEETGLFLDELSFMVGVSYKYQSRFLAVIIDWLSAIEKLLPDEHNLVTEALVGYLKGSVTDEELTVLAKREIFNKGRFALDDSLKSLQWRIIEFSTRTRLIKREPIEALDTLLDLIQELLERSRIPEEEIERIQRFIYQRLHLAFEVDLKKYQASWFRSKFLHWIYRVFVY